MFSAKICANCIFLDATGLLPDLGLLVRSLENAQMKERVFGNTPSHRNGVLVSGVKPGSCADNKILTGDILMQIDGVDISERGDVVFRGLEVLPWTYAVTKKLVGESVTVSLLRRGALVQAEIALRPLVSKLPMLVNVDYRPSWVIFAGLVFLPLGLPLVWQLIEGRKCPSELMTLAEQSAQSTPKREEEVIVLGGVLAHRINITFDEYEWCQLTSINGKPIGNMRALVRALSEPGQEYAEIDFKSNEWSRNHVTVNFAEEARTRPLILDQHMVSSWCAPQLLDEEQDKHEE